MGMHINNSKTQWIDRNALLQSVTEHYGPPQLLKQPLTPRTTPFPGTLEAFPNIPELCH